jgi:hypothetical protein
MVAANDKIDFCSSQIGAQTLVLINGNQIHAVQSSKETNTSASRQSFVGQNVKQWKWNHSQINQ